MSDHPYGWLSLLPPVAAIVLAIVTRRVVLSLLIGILIGAMILAGGNPLAAISDTLQLHLWKTLVDEGRLYVFAFTSLMGVMVGIINRSGGMRGLVDVASRWANNRCRGQLVTWMLGMLIFFDDYANTVLLGTTLKPLTDRLKISREKLAYVVDSTAAPVAGVALVSTWVAIEIDFIRSGLVKLPVSEDWDAFRLFIQTIPYRFYVLFSLVFVFLVGWTGRDFGPMLAAEQRSAKGPQGTGTGETNDSIQLPDPTAPDSQTPARWYNAVTPVAVSLIFIVWLLYATGRAQFEDDRSVSLIEIFGQADAYGALLWGALAGSLTAAAMSWSQGILSSKQIVEAASAGARLIFSALIILWLASSLSLMTGNGASQADAQRAEVAGHITESLSAAGFDVPQIQAALRQSGFEDAEIDAALTGTQSAEIQPPKYPFAHYRLYTGEYLAEMLQGRIWPSALPTLIFVLAAAVAFATGTSWGTMGIIMPLAIPLVYNVLLQAGGQLTSSDPIFLCSVGSVLAGAIFGDHCSPISDTTVLSSQASGCNHVAHVWTQMPYALFVAGVSILFGTLPIAFGVSVVILLPISVIAMLAGLVILGRRPGPDN